MKILTTIVIAFLLFGCNSDDPVIDKSFSIESTINQTLLDGNTKDDEKIIIEFKISDYSDTLSYLKIIWEYRNGMDTLKSIPIKIGVENFIHEDQTINYSYSISEEVLYGLVFTNLDSIARDSKFAVIWLPYDLDDFEIKSDDSDEFILDIKCNVDQGFMIGEYLIESSVTSTYWGGTYIKKDTISIIKGENRFERIVPITILENYDTSFKTEFYCGTIAMSGESMRAPINQTIKFFSESLNSVDFQNDDIIIIDFINEYTEEWFIGSYKDRITLTRI